MRASFRLQVWSSNILDYVMVIDVPRDTGTNILLDSHENCADHQPIHFPEAAYGNLPALFLQRCRYTGVKVRFTRMLATLLAFSSLYRQNSGVFPGKFDPGCFFDNNINDSPLFSISSRLGFLFRNSSQRGSGYFSPGRAGKNCDAPRGSQWALTHY